VQRTWNEARQRWCARNRDSRLAMRCIEASWCQLRCDSFIQTDCYLGRPAIVLSRGMTDGSRIKTFVASQSEHMFRKHCLCIYHQSTCMQRGGQPCGSAQNSSRPILAGPNYSCADVSMNALFMQSRLAGSACCILEYRNTLPGQVVSL
jgi:hypothetical protein